jgi:putative transposase
VTVELVDQAVAAGARREAACGVVGLCARTLERWREGKLDDERRGPKTTPANKLTAEERALVLKVVNEPRYRNESPNVIVPLLADEGRYVASESTMYRILRDEDLLKHRGVMKAPVRRPPNEHVATGPNQVWSWDITYLKTPIRGVFFFLYMIVDVWSRKIVGWQVHDVESDDLAAALFVETCVRMKLDPRGIVLHADNGGPMKGSTMVATLERLGVLPSFSRPGVSDDNPYSEALFRTLKYRPEYPSKPFVDVDAARRWVSSFVDWYNREHRHSGIRFVTPDARHAGEDAAILERRRVVYEAARAKKPERWSKSTRNWTPIGEVHLNAARSRRATSTAAPAAVLAGPEPKRGRCHPKGRSEAEEARSGALTAPQRRLRAAPPTRGESPRTRSESPRTRRSSVAASAAAAASTTPPTSASIRRTRCAPRRATIVVETESRSGTAANAQQRPDYAASAKRATSHARSTSPTPKTIAADLGARTREPSSFVIDHSDARASRAHARARVASYEQGARA